MVDITTITAATVDITLYRWESIIQQTSDRQVKHGQKGKQERKATKEARMATEAAVIVVISTTHPPDPGHFEVCSLKIKDMLKSAHLKSKIHYIMIKPLVLLIRIQTYCKPSCFCPT